MAGLLDIAPAAKRVLIVTEAGEQPVDVRGLSISDIRDLLARFPEAVAIMNTGLTPAAVMKTGPDIIAAIIAAACGSPGADGEAVAVTLGAGVQAEILTAVLNLTMPRGPAPFGALLKAAGLDLGALSAASLPVPLTSSSATDTAAPTP